MLKDKSITFKLILFFSTCGILIFCTIFACYYHFTRRLIERQLQENARNLTAGAVNRIEAILRSVAKVPENEAVFLEANRLSRSGLVDMAASAVRSNAEIFGSAIAFEPYGFDGKSRYFAPYCWRRDGRIATAFLGGDANRYFLADWYQIPRELDAPQWSEPYYDKGGGEIVMTTCSVPFHRTVNGKREVAGIVTADVSLDWLGDIVSGIKVLKTGYGFLISRNGTVVTHPNREIILNNTIFGLAEFTNNPMIRKIGRRMVRGETGFETYVNLEGKPSWIYYAPVPSAGWSLAVVFPRDEVMADVRRLNQRVLWLGLVGMLLLVGAVAVLSHSITGPLRAMTRAAEEIATGNLDARLPPVRSRDEVGRLLETFRRMTVSLKDYIRQLTETTAAKERMESELKIAHDIQMSILPKIFPQRPEFAVEAAIRPAREVGGDFYDVLPLGPDTYCLVIGDVSGKGVPAALFMAVTKTLFESIVSDRISPDEALARVNERLLVGNEQSMFATVFLCLLDARTGEVRYANGGHNLPWLVHGNGAAAELPRTPGLPVGAMGRTQYSAGRVLLQPGDVLFLYTDGVTEAMNAAGELFTVGRLKELLAKAGAGAPATLIRTVLDGIDAFAQGAEQSDDITMLALRYHGPSGK